MIRRFTIQLAPRSELDVEAPDQSPPREMPDSWHNRKWCTRCNLPMKFETSQDGVYIKFEQAWFMVLAIRKLTTSQLGLTAHCDVCRWTYDFQCTSRNHLILLSSHPP